jgi:hypothetical protein
MKKTFDRGFRPDIDPRILDSYVEDGRRTGRPKEIYLIESNSCLQVLEQIKQIERNQVKFLLISIILAL